MIEIVLRRPCRMIRMRMIEPEQLGAELARAALRVAIVGGPHEKPAARTFFGRIRQPDDIAHPPVPADERAAALVRIRLLPVRADRLVDAPGDRQRASLARIARLPGSRSIGSRSVS